MAQVREYPLQPIRMPAELGVERDFDRDKSHVKGVKQLDASDRMGFDSDTVFYDVFLSADGRRLNAIGPPLVNLRGLVLPVTWSLEEEGRVERLPTRLRVRSRDRATFFSWSLRRRLDPTREHILHARLACGAEATVRVQPFALGQVYLQMATLQKDNRLEWITDWVHFGVSQGVERFLIYDNGSRDFEGLRSALEALPVDVEVVLISWPFPYGPVRSYYNQYCQAGQNNHAEQRFAYAEWTGHLDVDEYVIGASRRSTAEELRALPVRVGLLRIDSYWVPNVGEWPDGNIPRVHDFRYRERQPREQAHKYFMRSNAYRQARTHNGDVRFGYLRKKAQPAELCFLHCVGLADDWRPYTQRRAPVPVDPELHVIDTRVAERLPRVVSS